MKAAAILIAATIMANDSLTVRDFLLDVCTNIESRDCLLYVVTVKQAFEAGYLQANMDRGTWPPAGEQQKFCIPPLVSAKGMAAAANLYFKVKPGYYDKPAITYLPQAWADAWPCSR